MELPDRLMGKAIDLRRLGLDEIAWRPADALALVDFCEARQIFILGGDVLVKEGHAYRHNHDSWHLDRERGDCADSVRMARAYIRNYPQGDFAFVIVTDSAVDQP